MNDLFAGAAQPDAGPVECLGQTFPSEQARREHFTKLLAEKLKDPAFRKLEGFPHGTDEAILAMSDPPYYTPCPNPFLAEFVSCYGKPFDPSVAYSREPQTIDVSVGKTDPLYKAHSYHTKVPHLAIVPSILHYTEPGDLVLDGFAGSGMTGVAAQWCGSAPADYRYGLETEWKKQGKAAPKWGARRVIHNDLSPAATFIAANYNLPFDVAAFAGAGRQLLKEVEQESGWMYETTHTDGKTKGRIEYTVWSEVFTCPHCAGEVNFLEEALDGESKRVKETFPCPHCGADLNKDNLERVMETRVDPASAEAWRRVKFRPALISYVAGGMRRKKTPDQSDLKVQGSYRQVTSTTAVKQDLVISAYKPNGGLEDRFNQQGPTVDSAWDFVQTHLKQLPAVKVTSGFPQELLNIVERDPRRLYDRMASWFIRHGAMVPLSTPEFLAELSAHFRAMDGMVFLPDQLVEYEKARSRIPQVKQAELFVADERSAIDWLTNFLRKRPSTRSEIHPEYIPQIGAAKRKGEIIPELAQLLEDNFIQYDGTGDVPSQIHAYLSSNWPDLRNLDKADARLVAKAKDRWYVPDPNKAQDKEKKREKALLKEFETYRAFTGRKIKESRLEVLRAGFRAAWAAKDYQTIIGIANKLPEETLQEDEKLLTLYDLALTRTEAQ